MSNKIFLLLLSSIVLMAEYVDLGTYGNTHEIIEKDFKEQLQEQHEKNFKKDKLEEEIQEAYKRSFFVQGSLKTCKSSVQREFTPTIKIIEDIKVPYNDKVFYKKGYEYNILKENNIFFRKYLIFIDTNDDIQIELAKQYSSYADIFVANGDIKKLLDIGIDAKIARDSIEVNMLNVECLPSVYTQQDYKFLINEYNPDDLKKEKKE